MKRIWQISAKGWDFCYRKCILQEMTLIIFLGFSAIINSLTLDNEKVISSTSTGISPGKNNLFDSVFEPKMSNLANGRTILNFNNSVLMKRNYS